MTSTTAADGADEVGRYPRGRVPRAVRLRHVLGLAEELFVERGYQQASMDELARRADVSKPVVYDLVGSKEQLFGTLMDRWADDLSARVSVAVVGEPDPAQRLRAGARAFFGFVGEHRAAWWALLSGDDAPVTAAFAAARERQAQVVARLVEQGARDSGEPVAPVQAEAVAHALSGSFEALARWWASHPDLPADELADLLVGLVGPGLQRFPQPTSTAFRSDLAPRTGAAGVRGPR